MNKGVIFVRVSKREQDYQRQLEDLRALAKTQNLEIIAEIAEKISGVKDNQERDGVQELLRLAQKGHHSESFSARSLSFRAFNGGSAESIRRIDKSPSERLCAELRIRYLKSGTPPEGKRNPIAQFMFTLLAEFARMERETLRERILSGSMEEARRQGKHLGRPDGSLENKETFLKKYPSVVRNLRQGISVRKTAKICDTSINTVRKVNDYLNPKKP